MRSLEALLELFLFEKKPLNTRKGLQDTITTSEGCRVNTRNEKCTMRSWSVIAVYRDGDFQGRVWEYLEAFRKEGGKSPLQSFIFYHLAGLLCPLRRLPKFREECLSS